MCPHHHLHVQKSLKVIEVFYYGVCQGIIAGLDICSVTVVMRCNKDNEMFATLSHLKATLPLFLFFLLQCFLFFPPPSHPSSLLQFIPFSLCPWPFFYFLVLNFLTLFLSFLIHLLVLLPLYFIPYIPSFSPSLPIFFPILSFPLRVLSNLPIQPEYS